MTALSDRPLAPGRRLADVDAAMALRLLGTVAFGRLVYTDRVMPAVRPVNHIVDHGEIVVCTRLPTAAAAAAAVAGVPLPAGIVVAYEADVIDAVHRTGWSVVVVGLATPITDPERIDRCAGRLTHWIEPHPQARWISIAPHTISGFQLVAG